MTLGATESDRAICGADVVTIVPSSNSMKKQPATSSATCRWRRSIILPAQAARSKLAPHPRRNASTARYGLDSGGMGSSVLDRDGGRAWAGRHGDGVERVGAYRGSSAR